MDTIWGYIFPKQMAEGEKMLKVLEQTPVFEGLPRGKLRKLLRILHERRYEAGETVFQMGEPGAGMYIICDGEISVSIVDESGTEKEVARLTAGQTVGDLALIEDHVRTATVKATTATHLLGLIRSDFLDLLSRDPSLGGDILMRLLRMLGTRLNVTNQLLVDTRAELQRLQSELKRDLELQRLVSGGAQSLKSRNSP